MSGPVEFARQQRNIDAFLRAPPSWDELVKEFVPSKVSDQFRPEERVAKLLAAMWRTEGRDALLWLFQLTLDAPYPHIGQTRDAAALAAKAHEARAAVGRVVLKAIAEGERLLDTKEPQA